MFAAELSGMHRVGVEHMRVAPKVKLFVNPSPGNAEVPERYQMVQSDCVKACIRMGGWGNISNTFTCVYYGNWRENAT